MYTTGNPEEDTARVKAAMEELLTRNHSEYAEKFGPFPKGEPWMPASLGGSAPTLEAANETQKRERAEKLAKQAEKGS